MSELSLTWFRRPDPAPTETVVATGIFDLLHVGHLRFLSFARDAGRLIVGVEDDARVSARKGVGRPIVPAPERSELLAALGPVDGVFIVSGPDDLWTPEAYAELMRALAPTALAFTEGDPAEPGKRRAAELLGASPVISPYLEGHSTTALAERAAAVRRALDRS